MGRCDTCDWDTCDIVIIGAGLAGLSLARHLQLQTDKRVLVLDKRSDLPPTRQKVGESLVQVGGYYFAKVLDMEEHMLYDQFMKYNLRFYWKNTGRTNERFEDYSQAYIRNFSNVPCYQLDRNTFEAELLRRIGSDSRFTIAAPVKDLKVELSDKGEPHKVSFHRDGQGHEVTAEWVVDTTGRGRMLARQFESRETSPIRHGSSFMWVEGLVDIEKLTDRSPAEIRRNANRRATGHLPHWLATNHFMGEGFWFWVIPLRGKTSLGLVYDRRVINHKDVASAEQLREWACREFPLFARDLPQRQIVDFSALKDFAHGCRETINPARWAMSGEAGRFTDPLYSPGSDFIALHNSLIVDAIRTGDQRELKRKCWLYEMLMQSMYGSLLPTYTASYDALGDQEAFVLKYTWELSVYFSFFVFPFMNDLATDTEFVPAFLTRFSRLGDLNAKVQRFLSDFYQWKKDARRQPAEPVFHDFMQLEPLKRAEQTFYHAGIAGDDAKAVLDDQLVNLKEMAKFIVAHVNSVVLEEGRALTNGSFIESIDLKDLTFDPARMRAEYSMHSGSEQNYPWTLNPHALSAFARHGELAEEMSPIEQPVRLAKESAARA